MDYENKNWATKGVAGAGLGTGIAGLSLGVLNALGNGGLLNGILGNCGGCAPVCNENMPVSRYDAQKDAEIAKLRSEVALRDANTFTDQKFADLNDRYNERFRLIEQRLAENAVKQQATDDSILLVNERLECAKGNIMDRSVGERRVSAAAARPHLGLSARAGGFRRAAPDGRRADSSGDRPARRRPVGPGRRQLGRARTGRRGGGDRLARPAHARHPVALAGKARRHLARQLRSRAFDDARERLLTVSESSWTALRRMFIDEYDELRRRLAVRLGSADAAGDALQDTFLQLAREGGRVETIHNPKGYLFRMAMNVANSRRRTERRRLSIVETQAIEAALETPDDRPGPAEVAEARSDLQLLRKVLDEMPQRRREMFLAALVDGASHRDLAERYGLSMRMIQIEMKKAGDLIAERFGRAKIIHFAPEPRETSKS